MWITHQTHGHEEAFFLFSKTFTAHSIPESLPLKVAAETRYRLTVNGRFASMGPVKRGIHHTYFDTVDIAPLLTPGENEIAVTVLHMNPVPVSAENRSPYTTILRRPLVGLAVSGEIDGSPLDTDETWLVAHLPRRTVLPPVHGCGYFEQMDFTAEKAAFVPATPLTTINFDGNMNNFGELPDWNVTPAPIPPLTHTPRCLIGPESFTLRDSATVLTPGVHTTGTLKIKVQGQKGTRVKITYAESYYHKNEEGTDVKRVRDDPSGFLKGSSDYLILSGGEDEWESFYWRCFRFVQIEVEGEAHFSGINYFECRYPMETQSYVATSDPDTAALWDISVRTVQNCMHDSFEDCPYYEQLQYVMDSRLQAIFLRYLSADKRLIQKCLADYNEGRFPDGMIPARVPSAKPQRIPGFAMHYIFMLHDVMLYERDRELLLDYLPVIDGILRWFEKRTDHGILGPVGPWSYVDWSAVWPGGVPSRTGHIAVYSFMLAVALENAADIAAFVGRNGLAEEYRTRAATVREAAKNYFYRPEKGYFVDSEEGSYSLHSQIWAVLSDAVSGEEAKHLLCRAAEDESLLRCSYSMMFFVMRAYEKAGLYGMAYQMLDLWRPMIRDHLTTWVEDPVGQRSDCHGWGSVPIYEFAACILGVKPSPDGTVTVKPYVYAHDFAQGEVLSPAGKIFVSWRRQGSRFTLTVKAPTPVSVALPDGTVHTQTEGTLSCEIS